MLTKCHVSFVMLLNFKLLQNTLIPTKWCGSKLRSVNRYNQCYAEFICESSTIIFKVEPGCAWILVKLIRYKMNGINTNNVHLIFVKLFKGDVLVEQALNKFFNVFFTFRAMCSSQYPHCPTMTGQVSYNFSWFRAMNIY